jgi:hypothetical protein
MTPVRTNRASSERSRLMLRRECQWVLSSRVGGVRIVMLCWIHVAIGGEYQWALLPIPRRWQIWQIAVI